MLSKKFKYIYGPVYSWRLGRSLGIDLLSCNKKVCNFDCIYCQLGSNSGYVSQPKIYVKTSEIIRELNKLPSLNLDYITFSGSGESTLAGNLSGAIKAVKKLNIAPVCVLTNAALINNKNIQKALSYADLVVVKLDAYSQASLEKINKPAKAVTFKTIIKGIKSFKKGFRGKLALQLMFVKENKQQAGEIAELAREINPDEIQINTPRRASRVKPLSSKEISRIKKYFSGMNFISVYDSKSKQIKPLNKKETLKRRKAAV
ncbi:MAG: radical SAM protein [Candidatus Omnitrophica bacterium]|nr:radical SAM protein [Candidatus Omnitrophota bacterium]